MWYYSSTLSYLYNIYCNAHRRFGFARMWVMSSVVETLRKITLPIQNQIIIRLCASIFWKQNKSYPQPSPWRVNASVHSAHREALSLYNKRSSYHYSCNVFFFFFYPRRPTSGQQRVLLARGNSTINAIIKQTPSAVSDNIFPSHRAHYDNSIYCTMAVRRVFVIVCRYGA